jgi:hypothetical protein
MRIGDFDTTLAGEQFKHLFDIRAIFKRRGRTVADSENPNELLFELTYDATSKYYPMFHSSSFRRILSMVANAGNPLTINDICSECSDLSSKKIRDVLEKAIKFELLNLEKEKYFPSRQVGFGHTLEWYVANVCVNELSSIAYWGVKVENLTGDYDVVVIRENQIGYIECKSGKLSSINRNDIINFLERERILAPQFSIYLVDGISRGSLPMLVGYALEQKLNYQFEIPGVMNTGVSLEAEEYRNFVRLTPINSFVVSVRDSLASTLREVYEFLTLVCDRPLLTENVASKAKFR